MLDRDLRFQPLIKYKNFNYPNNKHIISNEFIMGFENRAPFDQRKINYIELLACVSSSPTSEFKLKIIFKDDSSINDFLLACPRRFKKLIYSSIENTDSLAENHAFIFNPNNSKCLDEFLQIIYQFDWLDYQVLSHISGYSKKFETALNDAQINMIESFIKFHLDNITEKLANKADLVLKAFNAILEEKLSIDDINTFKAQNVMMSIFQIRKIFSHPYPHKPGCFFPFMKLLSEKRNPMHTSSDTLSITPTPLSVCISSTIKYAINQNRLTFRRQNNLNKDKVFEQKNLIHLTEKNDNTHSPVTKAAVVGYIYQIISDRIKKIKEEHFIVANSQNKNLVDRNSKVKYPHFFDRNRIMIANINVGYGKALFISGEDSRLGAWHRAIRMSCHQSQIAWLIKLDKSLFDTPFKFLIGPYSAEENPLVSDLTWESGENRKLALLFDLWPHQSDLWPSIFNNESIKFSRR